MIVALTVPAGPHARWTPESAESLVGQPFAAKVEDAALGEGKVLQALCLSDGHALALTVEWPDVD